MTEARENLEGTGPVNVILAWCAQLGRSVDPRLSWTVPGPMLATEPQEPQEPQGDPCVATGLDS